MLRQYIHIWLSIIIPICVSKFNTTYYQVSLHPSSMLFPCLSQIQAKQTAVTVRRDKCIKSMTTICRMIHVTQLSSVLFCVIVVGRVHQLRSTPRNQKQRGKLPKGTYDIFLNLEMANDLGTTYRRKHDYIVDVQPTVDVGS